MTARVPAEALMLVLLICVLTPGCYMMLVNCSLIRNFVIYVVVSWQQIECLLWVTIKVCGQLIDKLRFVVHTHYSPTLPSLAFCMSYCGSLSGSTFIPRDEDYLHCDASSHSKWLTSLADILRHTFYLFHPSLALGTQLHVPVCKNFSTVCNELKILRSLAPPKD